MTKILLDEDDDYEDSDGIEEPTEPQESLSTLLPFSIGEHGHA